MKFLAFVLLALSSTLAHADVVTYKCELMILADGAQSGTSDVKFSAVSDSGSHGGQEREFKSGPHRIVAAADSKWLALTWFKNETKIAQGLVVLGAETSSERVMILYNPANEDEQVSLDCLK